MRDQSLAQVKETPPTRLYLVRHGQVADGHTHRYHGNNDIGLSPEGEKQLTRLAQQLQSVSLAGIYGSNLKRSWEGAARLCQGRQLQPQSIPEFREIHFGVWEGLTFEEIAEHYPEELASRLQDLANFRIPGGESLLDVRQRVMPRLEEVVAAHPGQSLALVAHAGVNRVILCEALSLPLAHLFRLDQNYGCLNIIDYFPDFTVVRLMNGGVNGS
ncbi:MAG: alpha-ribazole phosphatase [Syntrophobacterales bacterium]|jgi:alpha-ribazole phosphatase